MQIEKRANAFETRMLSLLFSSVAYKPTIFFIVQLRNVFRYAHAVGKVCIGFTFKYVLGWFRAKQTGGKQFGFALIAICFHVCAPIQKHTVQTTMEKVMGQFMRHYKPLLVFIQVGINKNHWDAVNRFVYPLVLLKNPIFMPHLFYCYYLHTLQYSHNRSPINVALCHFNDFVDIEYKSQKLVKLNIAKLCQLKYNFFTTKGC